jgi:phospholipase C
MPSVDRRRFLQLAGGAAALAVTPTSIARAASIPASRRFGSIEDVEHVVILIQENRSFDHYFGTMRGVRGFGDPHPVTLPSGKSVWHQSDGTRDILPFRPDLDDLGLAFIQDLDHGWDGGHAAFNGGNYDRWVPTKTSTTMAHLQRSDMPFHYALADAFTLCDAYHCSMLGPTDPNRYYAWTGWVGNDGSGGGPVIANDELGYGWTTYPERLQQAGVSWKIYQDVGLGLDAAGFWGWTNDAYIGNYGDNSLLYFTQYQTAPASSPLHQNALTGTTASAGESFFQTLADDVRGGRLPQVSWIVAPEAFTEHPNWPANYGAWYVAQCLEALTADPDVWSKTALFLTYDENDGFFDHIVPPYPNVGALRGDSTVSTANELYTGVVNTPGGSTGVVGNYGFGQRVPMFVVSPWSTGGWVCSETFDHTSMIRFLEQRFGVAEPNITAWRRTVGGDLTSAFDFGRTKRRFPTLPSTAAYQPPDDQRHPDYVPVPPQNPELPAQEPGVRPSRALGYHLEVTETLADGLLQLKIRNQGRLGAQLQARSLTLAGAPFSYTLGAGQMLSPSWPTAAAYDLSLHGPNGFFRRFAGDVLTEQVKVIPRTRPGQGEVTLELHNLSRSPITFVISDAYKGGRGQEIRLGGLGARSIVVAAGRIGGWYDLTVRLEGDGDFVRALAGRLETGRDSTSDPQLGSN